MAQGGGNRRVQNLIFINANINNPTFIQEGSDQRVQSLTQTNVNADEIGQVIMGATANPAQNPEEAVVEEAQEQAPAAGNVEADAASTGSSMVNSLKESFQELPGAQKCAPANRLIGELKFEKAISLLEELPQTETQQLILAECYFQLNNNNKAMRSVGKLENMMTSSSTPSADDVMKTIISCIDNGSYIRALVLIACLTKKYKIYSNPNDAVCGVKDCSYKCFHTIKQMFKQGERMREIAVNFGIEIMFEILSLLRSIMGADASLKAEKEAYCLNNIGASYFHIGENLKAINFYQQGFDLLKRKFGSNAMKYWAFGLVLFNIGWAHERLRNYKEAKDFYVKAIGAYKKAEDWTGDSKKRKLIMMARSYLKNVRDKLDDEAA